MAEMTQTQIDNLQSACKEYGINWDGTYKSSDCGNVQISLNVATKNLAGVPKTRSYTVTYDANNPNCFDNVFSYMTGAGGDAVYAPPEYSGGINDYYLNGTTHNHIAFFCSGSDGPLPAGATSALVNALSENDNQRVYVDAASSAGTQSIPAMAINQFDNASSIYYMPIEAKGDGTSPGEPMYKYVVKSLDEHPELKEKIAGLYAFESANGGLTGPPSNAVEYLSKSADAIGVPGYMLVDPKLNAHAGKTSPDAYLSNGFIDDFFETVNPTKSTSSDNNDGNISIAAGEKETTIDENNTPLQFYNITGGVMATITAADFIAGLTGKTDVDFSINFDSVRQNLSILRNSVSATNLEGRKPYNCVSSSTFPNSLNDGANFLYATSKDLMNKMALDIQNVEKITSLLQETDENTLVKMLNETFGTNSLLGNSSDINSLAFDANVNNLLPDIFGVKINQGTVGRISMEDIDGIIRGNVLIGSIGNGLNQEIEETYAIKNDINNFLSTTNMTGPVWEQLKIRFNDYINCCDDRIEASYCLQGAYVDALNLLRNYYYETADLIAGSNIYMGGALDDGQIPVCQETIVKLEADIENLKAEFDMCMAVPRLRGTGIFVGEGRYRHEIMEPNEPEYTNAQMRAKEITYVVIPRKQQEIRYNNIYINQLNGLAGKLNKANEIIISAIDNIQANYTSKVSSIQPIMIDSSISTQTA